MTFLQTAIHRTENRPVVSHANPVETLAKWRLRLLERRHLRRLLLVAPHMIEDIGLTLEDARLEAEKPFWSD